METPRTNAGRVTERIMAHWRKNLERRKEPSVTTAAYNAAYEACLTVLEDEEAFRDA